MRKILEFLVNVLWIAYAIPLSWFAPNTASTGIAVGSDKPVLDAPENQPVTDAGSPALR